MEEESPTRRAKSWSRHFFIKCKSCGFENAFAIYFDGKNSLITLYGQLTLIYRKSHEEEKQYDTTILEREKYESMSKLKIVSPHLINRELPCRKGILQQPVHHFNIYDTRTGVRPQAQTLFLELVHPGNLMWEPQSHIVSFRTVTYATITSIPLEESLTRISLFHSKAARHDVFSRSTYAPQSGPLIEHCFLEDIGRFLMVG